MLTAYAWLNDQPLAAWITPRQSDPRPLPGDHGKGRAEGRAAVQAHRPQMPEPAKNPGATTTTTAAGAPTLVYLHPDHLHTPRLATDSQGTTVWRWDSNAFGATPAEEDPDQDGLFMPVNLRFPGQYYDQETGLHYNWNRYYDPRVGRYLQADPRGVNEHVESTHSSFDATPPEEVPELNPYAYVANNPLRYIDPNGAAKIGGGKVIPFPFPGVPGATGGARDRPSSGSGDGSRSRERPTRERPKRCEQELCQNTGQYLLKRYRPGDIEFDLSRPGLALYRCDYLCPSGATFSKTFSLREGFGGCPTPLPRQ